MELTVNYNIHFVRGSDSHLYLIDVDSLPPSAIDLVNVPRVSHLMALAIRLERLVKENAARDYADLARLGGVSRTRMAQIMNLLLLAPDIQEAILFLPNRLKGGDRILEKDLRAIAFIPAWNRQREMWAALVAARIDCSEV